jgi:hypothetical protein
MNNLERYFVVIASAAIYLALIRLELINLY